MYPYTVDRFVNPTPLKSQPPMANERWNRPTEAASTEIPVIVVISSSEQTVRSPGISFKIHGSTVRHARACGLYCPSMIPASRHGSLAIFHPHGSCNCNSALSRMKIRTSARLTDRHCQRLPFRSWSSKCFYETQLLVLRRRPVSSIHLLQRSSGRVPWSSALQLHLTRFCG